MKKKIIGTAMIKNQRVKCKVVERCEYKSNNVHMILEKYVCMYMPNSTNSSPEPEQDDGKEYSRMLRKGGRSHRRIQRP